MSNPTTPGYITVVTLSSVEVVELASSASRIWTSKGWDFERMDRERLESLDRQAVCVRQIDLLTPGVYWTQLQPSITDV